MLHLLASDLLQRFGTDLSRVAVVFPNKRASLFLNQELAQQAAQRGASADDAAPLWSPAYITISDLFRRHSDLEVADQILLVCRLYDVFIRITGYKGETLDRFYNWGVLLLADFDDLDKNMADAEKVFSLVTDLHELDDISYLEPEQREALEHFFSNFTANHDSLMQEKFLHLWSKLYEIYTTFREELRNDGLAYEGMLYRDVIEQGDAEAFEYDTYCFVGFNMLQQVEQRLFMRIKNMEPVTDDAQPRALFYWDYDNYYLNDDHEAGHFIREYLALFPDALQNANHSNFLKHKGQQLTYISAPTENLQARYVHDWLLENDRWKAGARTAIVMSDEHLLQTIIRSLPDEITKVNITTGYPLSQSPIVSLLQQLIEMQTAGRIMGSDKYRLRYVSAVLCHPYAQYISEHTAPLYQQLCNQKRFYPSRQELTEVPVMEVPETEMPISEGADGAERANGANGAKTPNGNDVSETIIAEELQLLFKDLDTVTLTGYDTLSQNVRMILWLQSIVKHIAQHPADLDALAKESIFRTYQVLQRLFSLSIDGTLDVDITTLRRLLMQIINTTTVPYHGEPIEGIQIMGILETRCLDFDHVLLLSCNEGNLPKGVNDSSFIPHSVRRAYGMTTVENKVGIFSYYFHRLLQRCGDVTLTYNSSTEGMNTGEMSRFMLQLMVEATEKTGINIRRIALQSGLEAVSFHPKPIVKSETIQKLLSKMLEKPVSPSSLGKYLRCQVMYYYIHVAGLNDHPDSDPDDMDNVTFGIVFHKAVENIYNNYVMVGEDGCVHAEDIERVLKNPKVIEDAIDEAFATELFHIDIKQSAYRPEYNGLQLINRRVIIRLLTDLLRYDKKSCPMRILGHEKWVYSNLNVSINGEERSVRIGGSIDRLDVVGSENSGYRMRVIDYKTGANEQGKMKEVADIFDQKNIKIHADYFLQAMLYSHNVRISKQLNASNLPVTPELYFVQKIRHESFSPNLVINNMPLLDITEYEAEFITHLSQMIADIHNPALPFSPTDNIKTCETCAFRTICGM